MKRKMLSTKTARPGPRSRGSTRRWFAPSGARRAPSRGGSISCAHTSVDPVESPACAPSLITPPSIISWYRCYPRARALADAPRTRRNRRGRLAMLTERRLPSAPTPVWSKRPILRRARRGASRSRTRSFRHKKHGERGGVRGARGAGAPFTTNDGRRERRSGGPSLRRRVRARALTTSVYLARRVSRFVFAERNVAPRCVRRSVAAGSGVRAGRTLMPVTSISMSVLCPRRRRLAVNRQGVGGVCAESGRAEMLVARDVVSGNESEAVTKHGKPGCAPPTYRWARIRRWVHR